MKRVTEKGDDKGSLGVDGAQSVRVDERAPQPLSVGLVTAGTQPRMRSILRHFEERYALLVVLILTFVGFTLALPDIFPTRLNLITMGSSQAIFMMLAAALSLPMRNGDFDLSISQTMSLSGALVAVLTVNDHMAWGVAVVVALLASLGIGLLNGFLVVIVGIDAFIATLGTMTIISGLVYGVTDSNTITGLPNELVSLGRAYWLGVPSIVILGWVVALFFWYVYRYTAWGRFTLFIGGNRSASRLAGIPVRRLRCIAFIVAALFAGLAGIVLVSNLGTADPSIGSSYLLTPFAAVFLGATTIEVGRINIVGMVIALYLLAIIVTGLELLGAASWVGDVFNGGALIVAVSFALFTGRLTRVAK